ncbi:MAG: hypothetical protein AAF502_18330 [Bacteroidota bacterium]
MDESKNNILNSAFVDFDLYAIPESEFDYQEIKPHDDFSGTLIMTDIPNNVGEEWDSLVGLLTKICQSVGLELGSNTTHINIKPETRFKFNKLPKSLKLKRLIVFGPTPDDLGMRLEIKSYQLVKWNTVDLIFVDSLGIIKEDVEKKKLLWSLLKQLFAK